MATDGDQVDLEQPGGGGAGGVAAGHVKQGESARSVITDYWYRVLQ